MSVDALKQESHFKVALSGITVIDFLAEHCPTISRGKLKHAMQCGAVWITRGKSTDRLRRVKRLLLSGDEIHLYYNELLLNTELLEAKLVADEIEYSIWNKPCGMFSQGTRWGDHTSICRWVEQKGLPQRQTWLVHRLDRATNGLILLSHSKKVTRLLTGLFESRQLEKRYTAIVSGKFPDSSDLSYIDSKIDTKNAVTRILTSHYNEVNDQSTLLLQLETGRKHQIRIHLSSVGFPIIGDRLHGTKQSVTDETNNKTPDLQLTSCYLKFICPLTGDLKEYTL